MYQNPAESAIFVAFSDVQNLTKSDPRFSHPDARLFSANDITYTVEVSDDMQTVDALNAAINAFSPTLIEDRIDYWSFHLGPKFSSKERKACGGLHRFWSIQQIEYCLNFTRPCSAPCFLVTLPHSMK